MKKILLLCIFLNITLAVESKFILNSYFNPNRLIFRLNKGSFECSMLGVVVPFYGGDNKCISEEFRKMSHLSIGYMENNLNLEQSYGLSVINGYCVLSYANINFNEKIIKDGYAVVNKASVNDDMILERLLYLQDVAIQSKAGLWNSFYDEMECLRETY